MFELNNFDSIRIGLASPEKIREWSYGEVTKPETINYRTQKPEPDGLFCEKIFGPTKDWRCRCGKYKLIRYKGVICDKCGVEVTKASVRRERMGHIELATPVSHIWFFRGVPSRIGTILDITPKNLEHILYYVTYVVTDPGTTPLAYKQILTDKEYMEAQELYGEDSFKAGMGAEAVKELLAKIDLEAERELLKEIVEKDKGQKKIKATKKLELVEAFIKSGNRPEWMIMDVVPVMPPELRPMVQLDGGRIASSDLNDLYRRVINRNNRLKKLIDMGAPNVIIRNEKRMLQESVDALIENGKRGKAIQGPKQRELKSLTAMLSGKQGRFRQNLLGKRVDYSGRSVIVVGPELKMYQCGLPKEMALELFKPFIMHELVKMNATHNIKSAKRMIDRTKPVVWDVLDKVIKDHPVLLNRAPTLHKLGIQAFEPVLIEGKAIQVHPLVCKGFHADFDGDQMPVHIPLSLEAQAEARTILLSTNNLLKPSDGQPICTPSVDIVLGGYYLTIYKPNAKGEGGVYINEDEAIMAHEVGYLDLQAKIYVRREAEFEGEKVSGRVETSVGRILFNRCVPQCLGFVDRTKRENVLMYEIDFPATKKIFGKITEYAYDRLGSTPTVKMLDDLKDLGFKYATLSGITMNLFDVVESSQRALLIKESEDKVAKVEKFYSRGLLNLEEKRAKNIEIWTQTSEELRKHVMDDMDDFNDLKIIIKSGSRGSDGQLNQMAGMRGLIANNSNQKVDVAIKSNYKRGFSPIEYFISSRGGRKVISDTAIKTSESGYLTRRLVNVAQEIVVTEDDCFANLGESVKGMAVREFANEDNLIMSFEDRIVGRFTVGEIVHPETGAVIVEANSMITREHAKEIVNAGIDEINIRTVFTCKSKNGVCAKCYGKNMSNNNLVPIGEAVGIIAAQSIGEPGTQLSMKNFSAGVVGGEDITQGLPRVEEIFEAKNPKGMAYISEVSGKVTINQVDKRSEVVVKTSDGEVSYLLPYGVRLKVSNGDVVEPGTILTEGSANPKDILRTKGVKGVEEYLLKEVLSVYKAQDISINPKHIEIIIRQMLRKVRVESAGDTNLVSGELVDVFRAEEENERTLMEGGVPAMVRREVLGITKASLSTESFLSAASFQETSKVLTDASVKGKVDDLIGLKENIMIGKLIPAGTGLKEYTNVSPRIVEEVSAPSVSDSSEQVDFDEFDNVE